MMARLFSCAVIELAGVFVEVDTSEGMQKMVIIGLPDIAVQGC